MGVCGRVGRSRPWDGIDVDFVLSLGCGALSRVFTTSVHMLLKHSRAALARILALLWAMGVCGRVGRSRPWDRYDVDFVLSLGCGYNSRVAMTYLHILLRRSRGTLACI